jgi:hypothetical protein
VSETAVYVAPEVAAVRALWDRGGARAGPVIGAQLAAFADALTAAHAARERAGDVLVGNWLEAPGWRSQSQGTNDELRSIGSLSPATGSRSVARWFPPTRLRSPPGSGTPARIQRQRSTRTEERPTP